MYFSLPGIDYVRQISQAAQSVNPADQHRTDVTNWRRVLDLIVGIESDSLLSPTIRLVRLRVQWLLPPILGNL
jgi:DNA topoisomerase IA